jgi:membrane associated rhomboid family serine protease
MTFRLRQADRNLDVESFTSLVTSPVHISAGHVHTLLSSTFVHGTMTDLALTMAALWWFGRPVARALGTARFLGTYLVCGTASSLVAVAHRKRVANKKRSVQRGSIDRPLAVSAAQTPGIRISLSLDDMVFGAAGAVNATVVLYTVLVPHASFAPFAYFVLRTIETGFMSIDAASFSRDVGHTSGILWGGLAAARLRNTVRVIR